MEFGRVPGRVPNLDHERIVGELRRHIVQPLERVVTRLERPRKLHQHRAQPLALGQRIQTGADRVRFVFRPRLVALVREALPQLGGELEVVVVGDSASPARRYVGPRRPVEGRVHLDRVEVARQIGQRVEPTGP